MGKDIPKPAFKPDEEVLNCEINTSDHSIRVVVQDKLTDWERVLCYCPIDNTWTAIEERPIIPDKRRWR